MPSLSVATTPRFFTVALVNAIALFCWAFLPSVAVANHLGTVTPLASPGLVSFLNVYCGQFATVSCFLPSLRVIVPSSFGSTPFTRGCSPSTYTGGQLSAHPPSQLDAGGWDVSPSNRYN